MWDAYLAGDVEGALRRFARAAVWYGAGDVAGPVTFRGHDEIRDVLDTDDLFSVRHVAVNQIADMGAFVLAHGVVYAERDGEVVVDRVTAWRFHVEDGEILRVDVEPMPSSRSRARRRTAFEG